MIKPRILDKNLLIMKRQIGIETHQWNGERIDIYRSLDGMSVIVGYKGQFRLTLRPCSYHRLYR